MPVRRLHESFDRLERLVAAYPRVALGSSGEFADPGSRAWWGRMAEAMDGFLDQVKRVESADGVPDGEYSGITGLRPVILPSENAWTATPVHYIVRLRIKVRYGKGSCE